MAPSFKPYSPFFAGLARVAIWLRLAKSQLGSGINLGYQNRANSILSDKFTNQLTSQGGKTSLIPLLNPPAFAKPRHTPPNNSLFVTTRSNDERAEADFSYSANNTADSFFQVWFTRAYIFKLLRTNHIFCFIYLLVFLFPFVLIGLMI